MQTIDKWLEYQKQSRDRVEAHFSIEREAHSLNEIYRRLLNE